MRIERIDGHGYDLRYVHGDFVMSGGRVVNALPSTVVLGVEVDLARLGEPLFSAG